MEARSANGDARRALVALCFLAKTCRNQWQSRAIPVSVPVTHHLPRGPLTLPPLSCPVKFICRAQSCWRHAHPIHRQSGGRPRACGGRRAALPSGHSTVGAGRRCQRHSSNRARGFWRRFVLANAVARRAARWAHADGVVRSQAARCGRLQRRRLANRRRRHSRARMADGRSRLCATSVCADCAHPAGLVRQHQGHWALGECHPRR